jgi:hypothetical protein
MEDFESFYLSRQKTHKLMWVYGQGTIDIKYNYLKKPYQSTSTAIQYSILLILEKADETGTKLSVEEITGKLAYNPNLIINEVTGLLFNISYNPKKDLKNGVITTDLKKDEQMNLKTNVWLNKEFSINSLKFSTIPQIIKVWFKVLFLFFIYFLKFRNQQLKKKNK